MERCDRCYEPIGKGYRCACERERALKETQAQVDEWVSLVNDENARREAEGEKGTLKAGFDGMKALARSARLNIPDLEERASFRRESAAEILGDPLKTAKWRRPRMLPPKSVYKEII
jgi:hypothetical protein